jgi:Cu/Ag efflux protein CusF
MKTRMRRRLGVQATLCAAALLLFAGTAGAQVAAPAGSAAAAADTAEAVIRKIDRDPPRLTLRHGEIRSLDMPPMTMVFRVQAPASIERLKVGDKVRFRAEKVGSDYTVTWIEPAP